MSNAAGSEVADAGGQTAAGRAVAVADPKEVAAIVSTIDLGDRAGLAVFGDKAQRDVVAYSDKILVATRNKDVGETGELLIDILEKAKGLDPANIKDKGFLFGLFSSIESRVRRFSAKFEDVASQIDAVSIELDRHRQALRRGIAVLDGLHEQTTASIVALDAYVAAGKQFADDFRAGQLSELKAKADAAGNSGDGLIAAQTYQDAVQALDRLEKRVFYLQQAKQIGIQQLPQIRIVQAGDETLMESLQATQALTIPVWKQKMVLLLGLTQQKKALELQKSVTDATNEMMTQASEMMKQQAIDIERQSQRGIVDIETLEKTNRDLVDAVTSVLRIQEEGRAKRAAAEEAMDAMTADLHKALAGIAA